jgi:hypothetical protein
MSDEIIISEFASCLWDLPRDTIKLYHPRKVTLPF